MEISFSSDQSILVTFSPDAFDRFVELIFVNW